jgi:L-galactose dehydrogenase/L-glyceraldehyde 3-phosphate reductase
MEIRTFGSTGLHVSALGFGCGSVGGLLVRGEYKDIVAVVGRAIDAGITYFDTALAYGNGQSETNLGQALKDLKADVVVGTKVRPQQDELDDIEGAIIASVENSLKRLQMERVDLVQLHNRIHHERPTSGDGLGLADIEAVLNAFRHLKEQGKIGFWGITGLGETAAVHQVIESGQMDTAQSCFNLLNPSAGHAVADDFPYQSYERLIDKAAQREMGIIAIRVLAAGALTGTGERHQYAAQSVPPIASGATFEDDLAQADRFRFLIEEGVVDNLAEAAIRFVISKPEVSTAVVGVSNIEQLDMAVAAANKGPLSAEIIQKVLDN